MKKYYFNTVTGKLYNEEAMKAQIAVLELILLMTSGSENRINIKKEKNNFIEANDIVIALYGEKND